MSESIGQGSMPLENEGVQSHKRLPLRKKFILPLAAVAAAGTAALSIISSGGGAGRPIEHGGSHTEKSGSSLIGKLTTSDALRKLGFTLGKRELPPGTTDETAPYYLQLGTSKDGKKTAFIGERNGELLGIEGNVVEAAISDNPNAKGELVLAASKGISPEAMKLGYGVQPADGDTIRVFRITKGTKGGVEVTAEGDLYTYNAENPLDPTAIPQKYVKQAGTSTIPAVVVGPIKEGRQTILVQQAVGWKDQNGNIKIGSMEVDSREIPA